MGSRRTLEDLQRKGFVVDGAKAVKENKIRGAEKQVQDGKKFASKLELYLFNLLTAVKIPFLFQVTITLLDKFKFQGSAIREIKIIVDFVLTDHDLIIDTKGFQLADNKLKFKMLKHKLVNEGKNTRIELPRTKAECDKLVNELLALNEHKV